MKKIFIIICFAFCATISFSQINYLNALSPFGNNISRVNILNGFGLPRSADTSLKSSLDTAGMMMFKTADNTFWGRINNGAGHNKWAAFEMVSSTPPTSAITITYNSETDTVIYIENVSSPNLIIRLNGTAGRQLHTDSIESIVLGNVHQSFTNPPVDSEISYTQSLIIPSNANNYFTNQVITKDGQIALSSANVLFENKWFYGFNSSNVFSSAIIQSLKSFFSVDIPTGKVVNLGTISGSEYPWFAFDVEKDPAADIRLFINGFDQTEKFTKSTQAFTNSFGYTTTYTVFVGNNTTSASFSIDIEKENSDQDEQPELMFGINQPLASDEVAKAILFGTSEYPDYDTLFADYQVDHWRYPGGGVGRYMVLDDSIISDSLQKMMGNRLADYYTIVNKPDKADQYRDKPVGTIGNEYKAYLDFCVGTHTIPLIQLNTIFYHQADTVYFVGLLYGDSPSKDPPIDMGLRDDRWDTIAANFTRYANYAHSIIGEDSVINWEIGNENYTIMPALSYADIVIRYTNIMKNLYPQDKVLWSISKGQIRSERKEKWNIDAIDYFRQNNFLSKLDYCVPHYYYPGLDSLRNLVVLNQDSIDARVGDGFFLDDYMALLRSYFVEGEVPDFWITEFSPIQTTADTNFNTQVNALILFDNLLKFHGDNKVVGATHHTGTGVKNGMFFDSSLFDDEVLSRYVNPAIHITQLFHYVSPSAEAAKIFMNTTGKDLFSYIKSDDYEALTTTRGTTKYIQILNYNNVSKSYNVANLLGTRTYTTYQLDDLNNHYWYPNSHTTTGTSTTTVTLPAHSFISIVVTPAAP